MGCGGSQGNQTPEREGGKNPYTIKRSAKWGGKGKNRLHDEEKKFSKAAQLPLHVGERRGRRKNRTEYVSLQTME